jgi:phosphate/sulfate permease
VLWSDFFNFLGVLLSTGAVAFGIIAVLPVELILQVGSSAGFAMVFAVLVAAIIWNLGTWYLGLPASSSHTLIGSIIGVGFANAMTQGHDGTSGVDWTKATEIGLADYMGLPVSTTHVLSSGVAGTMAANGSGLQWSTVRNMLLAWVLALPIAIMLLGSLYYLFATIF